MKATIDAATDTGLLRKENQDCYDYHIPEDDKIHKKGILLVVADGMGGHLGGAVASKLAVGSLGTEYYRDKSDNIPESLKKSFIKANQDVYIKAENLDLAGMGTTLTAVVLNNDEFYYAHVGDSRGYLIRNGAITQFTKDHTYVAGLVEAGLITKNDAKIHPERNKITRAVGIAADVVVDISSSPIKLKGGDYLLLSSDGLHGVVSDDIILEFVLLYKTPSVICAKLIEKANEKSGPDNITIMVIEIDRNNEKSDLIAKIRSFINKKL